MDATGRIAALAGPAAESAGLIVDKVEINAASSQTRVLITIDLPDDSIGSASLDAVAQASRAIGAALDEANEPAGAYVLEVSTPGVDRPLTERRHYLRARSRTVALRLLDGSSIEGRLVAVDDDTLELDIKGQRRKIGLGEVRDGRIVIEFKRLDDIELTDDVALTDDIDLTDDSEAADDVEGEEG